MVTPNINNINNINNSNNILTNTSTSMIKNKDMQKNKSINVNV